MGGSITVAAIATSLEVLLLSRTASAEASAEATAGDFDASRYSCDDLVRMSTDCFDFDLFNDLVLAGQVPKVVEAVSPTATQIMQLQRSWYKTLCEDGFRTYDCSVFLQDTTEAGPDKGLRCGHFQLGKSYVQGTTYLTHAGWHDRPLRTCSEDFWEGVRVQTEDLLARVDGVFAESGLGASRRTVLHSAFPDLLEAAAHGLSTYAHGLCTSGLALHHMLQVMGNYITVISFEAAYAAASPLRSMGRSYIFESELGHDRRRIISALLARMRDEGRQSLRAAEIGVYHADTSASWLQTVPELSVLLVDPYQEVYNTGTSHYSLHGDAPLFNLQKVRSRLDAFVNKGRAALLVAPSREAASWVANASLDLVFVDGDHAAEAVKADLREWMPKLRKGGIMAGHDFSPFLCHGGAVCAASQRFTNGKSRHPLAQNFSETVPSAILENLPQGSSLHVAPDQVWWFTVE